VKSGWGDVKNGKLLVLAATSFDVFITGDTQLQYQQNLSKLPIAVMVLATRNNMASLRPLVPRLLAQLATLTPCTLIELLP
jgi:hypothetical protein